MHLGAVRTKGHELAIAVEAERPAHPLALVMKGGGVLGLAYVGALRELLRNHEFGWFVGTSAGAILAVLLAAGFTVDELEKIVSSKSFLDFLDPPWRWPLNLVAHGGLHRGEGFTQWIDGLLRSKLNKRGPTPVTLGDLPHRVTIYASQRDVDALVFDSSRPQDRVRSAAFVVRCSISIPFFFTPALHEGVKVMDGGLRNNFPVNAFLRDNSEAEFVGLFLSARSKRGKAGLGGVVSDLASIWLEGDELQTLETHRDKIVVIDTDPVSFINFKLSDREKTFLLDCGRLAALRFMQEHYVESGS
jgi:predicted acylesterase/phospholipase RssA